MIAEGLIFFMIGAYRKKKKIFAFEKKPKEDRFFLLYLYHTFLCLHGILVTVQSAGLDKAAVLKMGEQKDGKIPGC